MGSVSQSGAFSVLIVTLLTTLLLEKEITIPTIPEPYDAYDYIVVGSGASGAIVASKLATETDNSILLVEAGGLPPKISRIPGLQFVMLNSEVDWRFRTEPQENVGFSNVNNQFNWPQGKMVGGSSSINNMVYYWPSWNDMESWAEETKDDRFRFQNVLKNFQQMEDATAVVNRSSSRGMDGHLKISSINCDRDSVCMAYLEAARFRGYSVNDINSPWPYGFMAAQRNIHQGRKWSVVNGYLLPALQNTRNKLHLLINSTVVKIEISNNRATGVRIIRNGNDLFTVRARKEVIVAAGAINTPKLLMLSGVGPGEHLRELGIPVIRDLAVGKNLMNHVALPVHYRMNEGVTAPRTTILSRETWTTYMESRQGPLSNTRHLAVGRLPRPSGKSGDVLLVQQGPGINYIQNQEIKSVYTLVPESDNISFPLTTLDIMLTHPKSRGEVTLQSKDPRIPPLMDPKYLSDVDDEDFYVETIPVATELMESPSLKRFGLSLYLPDLEECRPPYVPKSLWKPSLDSDYYVRCWVKFALVTSLHMAGTCKMGQPDREDTVVDTRFRVVGIDKLRVVDTSVFPVNVGGNTHGAALGIGVIAAETVIEDDRQRSKQLLY